jgi:hypothetical protein
MTTFEQPWDQEALAWTAEWEQEASPEFVEGEAATPAVRPRVLRTATLRRAWSQYACAERRMVPLTLFGRWTTPVNPETVAAWRAFEQALAASGYRVHRAWVFNCRSIKDRAALSLHAYGLAIDIDHAQPRCNVNNRTPDGRAVRFSSAATKEERCRDVQRGVADTSFTPDQVAAVEAIQTVDGHQVFTWGGRWATTKDTMHFQLNVTPAELARGIRTDSVRATTASGSAASASPAPTPRRSASPGTPPSTGETQLGTLLLEAQGWPRFSYRFTPTDALWTAKLLKLEAGGRDDLDNAAVLWAMFNRYAFFTHRVRAYPTFAAYLRAYSTTLQPVLLNKQAAARHVHSPEFVRTGGYYAGTRIPKGQLRRHLDVQAQPWTALDATTRAFTLRALRGSVPNPGIGNASEFASTRVYWKQRNKTRREPTYDEWRRFTEAHGSRQTPPWRWIGEVPGLNQRKNAFFLDARVARLPRDAVRMLPP